MCYQGNGKQKDRVTALPGTTKATYLGTGAQKEPIVRIVNFYGAA